MNEIKLLPMNEAYAPGAARLDQITFPGEAWSEAAFLREARTPSSFYVVAVQDEEVVGFAGLQQVLDEGYITTLRWRSPAAGRGWDGRCSLPWWITAGKTELPFSPWKCGSPMPLPFRSMNPWAFFPKGCGKTSTASPPKMPF